MNEDDGSRELQMKDLRKHLKELVLRTCQVRGVTVDEIDDDAPLIGGPGGLQLDSLDALEIAVALHREFGIEIVEEEATKAFESIRTLSDFLLEKAGAAAEPSAPS